MELAVRSLEQKDEELYKGMPEVVPNPAVGTSPASRFINPEANALIFIEYV